MCLLRWFKCLTLLSRLKQPSIPWRLFYKIDKIRKNFHAWIHIYLCQSNLCIFPLSSFLPSRRSFFISSDFTWAILEIWTKSISRMQIIILIWKRMEQVSNGKTTVKLIKVLVDVVRKGWFEYFILCSENRARLVKTNWKTHLNLTFHSIIVNVVHSNVRYWLV